MSAPVQNRLPTTTTTQATEAEVEAQLERMLARADKTRGQIAMTADGVEFGDFAGVQRYAMMLCDAGLVPLAKDDNRQTHVARATACILLGRRIGLSPEQAVQSIYVVNCRPQLFGDAPLAICRQHKSWDESGFAEYWLVAGKPYTVQGPDGKPMLSAPPPEAFKAEDTAAVCQVLRRGSAGPVLTKFSMGDAKQAGLLGKSGSIYSTYTQRMLMFRARGYRLRDTFSDALRGIGISELSDPEPTTADRMLAKLGDAETNGSAEHAPTAGSITPAPSIPVVAGPPPEKRGPGRPKKQPDTAPVAATAAADGGQGQAHGSAPVADPKGPTSEPAATGQAGPAKVNPFKGDEKQLARIAELRSNCDLTSHEYYKMLHENNLPEVAQSQEHLDQIERLLADLATELGGRE